MSGPGNKTARPINRILFAVAQHIMPSNDSQRRVVAKTAEPHMSPQLHSMVRRLCRVSCDLENPHIVRTLEIAPHQPRLDIG